MKTTEAILGFSKIDTITAKLTEEGFIEIVRRKPSDLVLTCYPPRPAPDEVWKEVYGVVDGKIQLIKTVKREHKPSEFVREQIIFE